MAADDLTPALARAEARLAALEHEVARITEEGLREADAMFAQYQLSQLLAAGGPTGELADAIAAELARLTNAQGVAVWVRPPDRGAWSLAGRAARCPPVRRATTRLGRGASPRPRPPGRW